MVEKDCDNGEILWSMKGVIIIEGYYNHWKILWSLKNIVIIEKYCDNGKILWSLKNIVIMKKDYDDWNLSNINKVIRTILNFLFFFFT